MDVEAILDGERGEGMEALVRVGIWTRLGHSYWRPRRPEWLKLEAWVQLLRSGEVKKPMVAAWA